MNKNWSSVHVRVRVEKISILPSSGVKGIDRIQGLCDVLLVKVSTGHGYKDTESSGEKFKARHSE